MTPSARGRCAPSPRSSNTSAAPEHPGPPEHVHPRPREPFGAQHLGARSHARRLAQAQRRAEEEARQPVHHRGPVVEARDEEQRVLAVAGAHASRSGARAAAPPPAPGPARRPGSPAPRSAAPPAPTPPGPAPRGGPPPAPRAAAALRASGPRRRSPAPGRGWRAAPGPAQLPGAGRDHHRHGADARAAEVEHRQRGRLGQVARPPGRPSERPATSSTWAMRAEAWRSSRKLQEHHVPLGPRPDAARSARAR